MRRVAAALAAAISLSSLAALGALAAARNNNTRGGGDVSARQSTQHVFLEVYRVMQHPRCKNCHPAGDHPLHGDDSHPHSFRVKRGDDGRGLPGARCVKCHQAANQAGAHKPPGAPFPPSAHQPKDAPRWHLPAARMPLTFQGRTPAQLCRQLLDPNSNGGLAPAALIAHVEHDPFVKWGWQPGDGRTTPPGTHAGFVDAVRAWIAGGPACPVD